MPTKVTRKKNDVSDYLCGQADIAVVNSDRSDDTYEYRYYDRHGGFIMSTQGHTEQVEVDDYPDIAEAKYYPILEFVVMWASRSGIPLRDETRDMIHKSYAVTEPQKLIKNLYRDILQHRIKEVTGDA